MIDLKKLRTGPLAHFTRRHRRSIAAACAALAVLLALGSVRSVATPASTDLPTGTLETLVSGYVAIPVPLSPPAAAGLLHVGDIIDLIAVTDTGIASTVARGARVTGVPAAGGFMSNTSALVLVAVDEPSALRIAGATGSSDLTFAMHPKISLQ